jgi:hypothetical protein
MTQHLRETAALLTSWFKILQGSLFLSLIPVPAKSSQAASDAIARQVVRSCARSNLNLQRGRYMTAQDIEDRKQALAKHSF